MAISSVKNTIEQLKAITEASVSDSTVKKIARLTDANNHSEARILVATAILKNKKLAGAYEALVTIRDFLGHMPSDLVNFQYNELDSKLKDQLFRKLSKDDAELVWGNL